MSKPQQITIFLLGLLLAGCNYSASAPPTVAILHPQGAAALAPGEGLVVLAEAQAGGGVQRIDFLVDGNLAGQRIADSPGTGSLQASFPWPGAASGTHQLSVIAYDESGRASEPAAVQVAILEPSAPSPAPEPAATRTTVPSETPTEQPAPTETRTPAPAATPTERPQPTQIVATTTNTSPDDQSFWVNDCLIVLPVNYPQGRYTQCPGADLSGVDLSEVVLTRADLRGANLRESNLESAGMLRANLSGADLQGALLHLARMAKVNLQDADLRGANLRDASLRDADLTGANLIGAGLDGVVWDNTTCPDGINSDSARGTCQGHLEP